MDKQKVQIGDKYGKLTVVEKAESHKSPNGTQSSQWLCQCECGNFSVVKGYWLTIGKTKSCGCIQHKIHGKSNLIGQKFGRLLVIDFAETKITKSGQHLGRYKVRCDCGTEYIISSKILISGDSCSCGCYAREKASQMFGTHRKSKERIYDVWTAMKQRCYNPKSQEYHNYGGRGIKVSTEWLNFQNFYDWAYTNGYKEEILPNGVNKWTIDRIDVNGNYEPNNCRWVTNKEQQQNKRPKLRA